MKDFIYSHRKNVIGLLAIIIKIRTFSSQNVEDYIIILTDIISLEILASDLSAFFEIIFNKLQNLGTTLEIAHLCNCILEK